MLSLFKSTTSHKIIKAKVYKTKQQQNELLLLLKPIKQTTLYTYFNPIYLTNIYNLQLQLQQIQYEDFKRNRNHRLGTTRLPSP